MTMAKLISQNVRGLGDETKRKEVFYHFRSKADIVCIQETHGTLDKENEWGMQWGGPSFWSHGTSQARGVAVLVRRNMQIVPRCIKHDDVGRYIIFQFEFKSRLFLLVNIYAPNEDKPMFFLEIFKKIEEMEGKRIFMGDFNMVLEPEIDRNHKSSHNNNKVAGTLQEFMQESLMVDVWRERNPNKIQFTFRQHRHKNKQYIAS